MTSRAPDTQYRDVLSRVLADGEWTPSPQGPAALTAMQQVMRFNLAEVFPVITERDLSAFWRKPIGELAAFINGATTEAELARYGCDWWGPWATEAKTAAKGLAAGDLGPGSYGGAFRRFPTAEGPPFDQFAHLVAQIRELPGLRTHFVSPWIPQYQARGAGNIPRTTIAPCHGWVHVRIAGDRLHLHMFQRSGDLPIGVPSNMIQYAALALMLANVTGYRPGVYYHTISDAHIYEDQLPAVKQMLDRPAKPLPTVDLTPEGASVSELQDMRPHHFALSGYHPHPAIRAIPVAA